MLFALSFNPLCLGLCRLTQGRYSMLKAGTFWSIFPKGSGIVVQRASCFFQRTALYSPWTCGCPGSEDEERPLLPAFSLALSLSPFPISNFSVSHRWPQEDMTRWVLLIQRQSESDPWFSRPRGMITGTQERRDVGVHPVHLVHLEELREIIQRLLESLWWLISQEGLVCFPLPFYNSSFVLKHLNPHHLN